MGGLAPATAAAVAFPPLTSHILGTLKEITTQGEPAADKTEYSYNAAGQLVRTEEYTGSQLQYYFTYEYNARGQLITKYSFAPQTPASTVFEAGLKREYAYDPRNNLSRVTASWKAAGSSNWGIFLTHQYSEYDNGHLSAGLFLKSGTSLVKQKVLF